MGSLAHNHETWHSYKWRGQAVEGQGSRGSQAWINNKRQRASHPAGRFVSTK